MHWFDIKRIQRNTCMTEKWLLENSIHSYNLDDASLSKLLANLSVEIESEFDELNAQLKLHLDHHDKYNKFKLIAYLVESLSSRVYLAYDELNSVQIVQYVYAFLKKLITLKEYTLVAYCLLEIVLQHLNTIIDLVEYKRRADLTCAKTVATLDLLRQKNLINEKLYENTFFMSSLMCKQINKTVKMFICLIDAVREEIG